MFASIHSAEVVATIFYSVLGLALLIGCYAVLDRITHFSLHEELAEKQNVAVAIVIGSFAIALALIISRVIAS